MIMDDVWIKHKDKDRDTYVIHWWEFQISVWRCNRSSEPLLSCYLHPISLTPFHGWLYARASPLSVATSPPLSENGQRTLSRHGYSSVGSRSCWNRIYYPFASVTNAPQSRVWSSSQSFNHWILLGIPQTRFRLSGFSWMPPSVLAYTTKILIKRSKRYSFNSNVERKWLSGTRS
mgnify:CR=1 FL=1